MNDITKKLQKLAKTRRTQKIVIKKGTLKYKDNTNSSNEDQSYNYSDNN